MAKNSKELDIALAPAKEVSLVTEDMIDLGRRQSAGLEIALLWGRADSFVVVVDALDGGNHFELPVGGDQETRGKRALDLFHHTFSHLAEVKDLSESQIFATEAAAA